MLNSIKDLLSPATAPSRRGKLDFCRLFSYSDPCVRLWDSRA